MFQVIANASVRAVSQYYRQQDPILGSTTSGSLLIDIDLAHMALHKADLAFS
jgi:hypothetical protein